MCSAEFASVVGVVDKGEATVFLDQGGSLGVCRYLGASSSICVCVGDRL